MREKYCFVVLFFSQHCWSTWFSTSPEPVILWKTCQNYHNYLPMIQVGENYECIFLRCSKIVYLLLLPQHLTHRWLDFEGLLTRLVQASTTIWLQKAIIWTSFPAARTQGYYLQKWTSVLCLIHSSNICTCISSFSVWMFLCCMGSLRKFVHIILSLNSIRFFKFLPWLSNLSILHFLPNENFQLLQNLFQNVFSSRTFPNQLHLILHFI